MDKPLSELEKDLVFKSIALDLAIACLAKITGKSGSEWADVIAQTAIEMVAEIPPEDMKRILRGKPL